MQKICTASLSILEIKSRNYVLQELDNQGNLTVFGFDLLDNWPEYESKLVSNINKFTKGFLKD